MSLDELTIPDHIDPARWPFDEQRTRERTAIASTPHRWRYGIGKRQDQTNARPTRNQVIEAQIRRRLEKRLMLRD